MFCPDKYDREGKPLDDVRLYGPDDTSINRHIEIVFKPCTPGLNNCPVNQTLDK